jgi:hypothetical protein
MQRDWEWFVRFVCEQAFSTSARLPSAIHWIGYFISFKKKQSFH